MKTKLIPIVILAIAGLCITGCHSPGSFDKRLNDIVAPYRFSTITWESRTIPGELLDWALGWSPKTGDKTDAVTEYFSTIDLIKALEREIRATETGDGQGNPGSRQSELAALEERKGELEDTVEKVLEEQIEETLAAEGIFNPFTDRLKIILPPLNFILEKPPHLLVISPRDRIETIREMTLKQDLSLEEIEAIENEAEKIGVSALVVKLGGMGSTYPAFVTNDASLSFTIDAATEEWLHQYLFFKPLGILYTLDLTGISPDYEIATINETVASMTSEEIGDIVYRNNYPALYNASPDVQTKATGFDFSQEMRQIRRAVDEYLARGEIELAEEYMEDKQQYLASQGYYIRKLNQAYFAFHGAYADSPTSVNPIGLELEELREESGSIKDFLEKSALITGRKALREALEEQNAHE
ncbi:MAG: hypothetical protein R6T78_04335 [Dehalococcoidales bacterium]